MRKIGKDRGRRKIREVIKVCNEHEMKQNETNDVHYLTFYLSFYFIVLLFALILFLDATKMQLLTLLVKD